MKTLEDCKDLIAQENDYQGWDDFYEIETDYDCRLSYLEDAAEMYAMQFDKQWISLSDKLPEEGSVLALTSYEKIVCAYFIPLSNEWDVTGYDEPKKLNFISHWMDLPELK